MTNSHRRCLDRATIALLSVTLFSAAAQAAPNPPLYNADFEIVGPSHDMNDVSVWTTTTGLMVPYIARSLIHARIQTLGFQGSLDEVDVDALMVQDSSKVGQWDEGDEILFSIRASNNFDGGEIIHLRFGAPASFLNHGGHTWDTGFEIGSHYPVETEEVDAIEVPEPCLPMAMMPALGMLWGLSRRFVGLSGFADPNENEDSPRIELRRTADGSVRVESHDRGS